MVRLDLFAAPTHAQDLFTPKRIACMLSEIASFYPIWIHSLISLYLHFKLPRNSSVVSYSTSSKYSSPLVRVKANGKMYMYAFPALRPLVWYFVCPA